MRLKVKNCIKRKDGGYVVVAVAALLLTFCAILGLATDVGYLFMEKTRMQGAADTAATGGAMEALRGQSGLTTSGARDDAAANGYADGVGGVIVTVNRPPLSGDHVGDALYIEALVDRAAPTFFMKAFGRNSVAVQARAVAGLVGEPNCIYALAPSGSSTLVLTGSSIINIPCGVAVDSTDPHALSINGGACLHATSIDVTGGSTGCTTPAPNTNAGASGDPIGYLTEPAVGACDFGTGTTPFHKNSASTQSISPGVYCGGITSSKGTLNLNPGLYILKGGGLALSGTATFNGNGVTFYNTCDSGSCLAGTTGYDPVSIAGGITANLAAPTTGVWAGMLFFADRNAPGNATNSFSGGSQMTLTGTLYFPTEKVTFTGGSTGAALYTNIVAWEIAFNGSTTLNHDLSVLPGGSPLKRVALVE